MINILLIAIIIIVVGGAAGYLYRAKKRGQACVGCPYAKHCSRSANGCGCSADTES